MNKLKITNKDWVVLSNNKSKSIIQYDISKLVTPVYEDIDLFYLLFIIHLGIILSHKYTKEKNHIAIVRLKDINIYSLPLIFITKTISYLQKYLPNAVSEIHICDFDPTYIDLLNCVKKIMDPVTINKVKIYTIHNTPILL